MEEMILLILIVAAAAFALGCCCGGCMGEASATKKMQEQALTRRVGKMVMKDGEPEFEWLSEPEQSTE